MARLKLFDLETSEGAAGYYLKTAGSQRGRVNNHVRLYAHSPFLARLGSLFSLALHREGLGSVLSCKIKEMAIIKTSKLNGCGYCYAHNTALGEAAGITEEQVMAIDGDDYMTSPHLSPRERAAVLWAEHVTKNTAKDRDDVFEQVAKHFDERELFELTLVTASFNSTNRVHDSLRLELEPQDNIDKIRSTARGNPDLLKAQIQAILDNWPDAFPEPNPD